MQYETRGKIVGLNKENILKKTTEAEIYRHFLGIDYEIGTLINSPLPGRKDKTPSFGIYWNKAGILLWNDFGNITKNGAGDVFKFVQIMENSTFLESLLLINESMHLGISHTFTNSKTIKKKIEYTNYQNKENKKNAFIQIIIQNFTISDLNYWQQGGISKTTLNKFGIFSVKTLYYNFIKLWTYSEINPIYSWSINNKIKGYRPKEKNKKFKWINNCTGDLIQGIDFIPESGKILYITKSMKDVVVFYELGIPAIAPQSENIILTEDTINSLFKRFDNIVVMFDNDESGITAMKEYEFMHGLPYEVIPIELGVKDPFEYVTKYGQNAFKKFLT